VEVEAGMVLLLPLCVRILLSWLVVVGLVPETL
jgi:hypothetical protein